MTVTWRSMLAVVLGLALLVAACAEGAETEGTAASPAPAQTTPTDDATAAVETETEAEAAAAEGTPDTLADNPLAGEVITFVVGVSPGGGYDAYARLLAPFLAEQLDADVIVENRPGAGGLLALNELLAAPADGTRIMLANGSGIAGAALAEAEGVQFELEDLAYIGRVYAGDKVVATGADSEYDSVEDLMGEGEPFTFGSSGPGASTYVEPTVLTELLDLNATIITGFGGSSEINASMVTGDVDGILVDLDTQLPLIETGDSRPLLLVAEERSDRIPDTPALGDLELDDRQQELAEALLALLELGRVLVAHPDTPQDALQALRDAFGNILTDQEFVSAAESQGRPIGYLSGDEVEGVVETILEAPPEFRELLEAGYEQQ